MPRFSPGLVDRVLEQTDIVALISPYSQLKKNGNSYKGLCPFHTEKTPSFSVNPDKGFFHCFGCGESGDSIEFVRKIRNATFAEAVEFLASSAGIPVTYEEDLNENQAREREQRKRLVELNRLAARHYYVAGAKSREAAAYIAKRGIGKETVYRFGIGYAPTSGGIVPAMSKQGFSLEELEKTGLVRKTGEGKYRDYFYGRLMFPILDVSGAVIAFGGRTLGDAQPKYLNSPETPLFSKKATLYNLNEARKHANREPLVLVEGYMDVVSLSQYGVHTAIASLGTSLTEGHARLIKRYSENVVICYDADRAGIAAAVRACDILTQAGLVPKVLCLPAGEDPDSFASKNGGDAFRELLLRDSKDAVSFKLDILAGSLDENDILSKQKFVSQAAEAIALLKDEVAFDHFAPIVAAKAGTQPSVIRARIQKAAESASETPKRSQVSTSGQSQQGQRVQSAQGQSGQNPAPRPSRPPESRLPVSQANANAERKNENKNESRNGQEYASPLPAPSLFFSEGVQLTQRKLLAFIANSEENWKYFKLADGDYSLFEDGPLGECYKYVESHHERQISLDGSGSSDYNDLIAQSLSSIIGEHPTLGREEALGCIRTLRKVSREDYMKGLKAEMDKPGISAEDAEGLLAEYTRVKHLLLEENL